MILLKTIHGSRLSGLARPDSDWDWYTVVDDGRTRQRINGDQDKLTVSLADFLRNVYAGEVAALCALWSPVAEIDPRWAPMFASLHPDIMGATRKFSGAISAFAVFGTGQRRRPAGSFDTLDLKAKRHMLRLSLFLDDLWRDGRFCPRLDADTLRWVIQTAEFGQDEFTSELLRTCPVSLYLPWMEA